MKTMGKLLRGPGVPHTPEECMQLDSWDDTFKEMVTNFWSVPEWFDYIQKRIDDLKEEKKGWKTFKVEYDCVYGCPLKIQFMSGSPPTDELTSSSSSSPFCYFDH